MLVKHRSSPADNLSRSTVSAVMGRRPKPVRRWHRGEEPSVTELLADPVLHRLLARDNIALEQLRAFVDEARERLLARA